MNKFCFVSCILNLLIIASCSKKPDELKVKSVSVIDYASEYNNKKLIDSLLYNAIVKGDTVAYNRVYKYYVIADKYQEFLYYAIQMAEKQKFSQAYFDAYFLLKGDYLIGPNTNETKLGTFYLLKAYENGNQYAKDEIGLIYLDKKLIPKSEQYLKHISR